MTGFALPTPRRSRRPSLTPMIDVVFLLLVFFMLASRFGAEGAITIRGGQPGGATAAAGPPRLVDVRPDSVALNGRAVPQEALAGRLAALVSDPGDLVVLRPRDGVDVQRMVDLVDLLRAAGLGGLVIME